jgi:hypothetical protein
MDRLSSMGGLSSKRFPARQVPTFAIGYSLLAIGFASISIFGLSAIQEGCQDK